METIPVQLGKRITAARNARGWSRADLARRAAVDPSYVTRIEEAHYKRPSVDKVALLASALGIRVTDLTDPPEPPAPYSEAAMREALLARGFRAYETAQVDRLLTILAGCNADERDDLLRSLETILSARQRRDDAV